MLSFLFLLCKTSASDPGLWYENRNQDAFKIVDFQVIDLKQDKGGFAHFISCQGDLIVQNGYVARCTANQEGGAFYVECANGLFNAEISSTCFYQCSAQKYNYGYFYMQPSAEFGNTLSSIFDCSSNSATQIFAVKDVATTLTSWNFSTSTSAKGYAIEFFNSPTIKFFNFEYTNCEYGISISKEGSSFVASNIVGVKPSMNILISLYSCTMKSCFFKENDGVIKHTGKLSLIDCYFDKFEHSGKQLEMDRVAQNTDVFPTNFDIYETKECKNNEYQGIQTSATENPPATPPPTQTLAPTPYPTRTPAPTPIPIADAITGLVTNPVLASQGRIVVADALFIGFTNNCIICKDTEIPTSMELTRTTYYDIIVGGGSSSNAGGCLKFEPKDDPGSYSLINRTCAINCYCLNAPFGSIIVGNGAKNQANLTTLTYCSDGKHGDCYNTVDLRKGEKLFYQWNSSYSTNTDTAGVYTDPGNSEASYSPDPGTIKASFIYSTFAYNKATRNFILNDFGSLLTYDHMNIVGNEVANGGGDLCLLYGSVATIKDCIFLDNKFGAYFTGRKIGDDKDPNIFKQPIIDIIDTYLQPDKTNNWGNSISPGTDNIHYETTEKHRIVHFANALCQVEVSAPPLAPEPTFPTRCFKVLQTENLNLRPKMTVTKVGMNLVSAAITDFI